MSQHKNERKPPAMDDVLRRMLATPPEQKKQKSERPKIEKKPA